MKHGSRVRKEARTVKHGSRSRKEAGTMRARLPCLQGDWDDESAAPVPARRLGR